MNDRIVTSMPSAMLMAKHRATMARPVRVHCAGLVPALAEMGVAMPCLSRLRRVLAGKAGAAASVAPGVQSRRVTQAMMMSATWLARRASALSLVMSTPKLWAKVNWLETL
jgi:hypothetical protein